MARRREDRVGLSVPVRIWGLDCNGKPFSQQVHTVDITRLGARLRSVTCSMRPGDIIGMQHGNEKARFRVTWVGKPGCPDQGQIGVHCVEPTKFIWGVTLPKAPAPRLRPVRVQQQSAEGGAGRRSTTRYACEGSVELRREGGAPALWGVLCDVSLTGCYVETTSPLPAHTRVEVLLKVEGVEIRGAGIVRTSHPSVGMGIALSEMSVEDRDRLDRLIAELEARATGKFPAYKEAPAAAQIAEISARLQTATTELKELEHLLAGNGEIDRRLLRDFGSAVNHARQVAWIVQQWLQLSAQRRDPFELLYQLEEEQVRFGIQLSSHLGMEIDATSLNLATRGITDLHTATQKLHRRLLHLVDNAKKDRTAKLVSERSSGF
jgi:hypothetical protein